MFHSSLMRPVFLRGNNESLGHVGQIVSIRDVPPTLLQMPKIALFCELMYVSSQNIKRKKTYKQENGKRLHSLSCFALIESSIHLILVSRGRLFTITLIKSFVIQNNATNVIFPTGLLVHQRTRRDHVSCTVDQEVGIGIAIYGEFPRQTKIIAHFLWFAVEQIESGGEECASHVVIQRKIVDAVDRVAQQSTLDLMRTNRIHLNQ